MRTRKRKSSTVSKGEQNSSKRARLLSSLWQLEDDSVIGTERSSASNATVVYQINGIIKERPGEYLIAWADDPVTGERYNPNWVRNYFCVSCAKNIIMKKAMVRESMLMSVILATKT